MGQQQCVAATRVGGRERLGGYQRTAAACLLRMYHFPCFLLSTGAAAPEPRAGLRSTPPATTPRGGADHRYPAGVRHGPPAPQGCTAVTWATPPGPSSSAVSPSSRLPLPPPPPTDSRPQAPHTRWDRCAPLRSRASSRHLLSPPRNRRAPTRWLPLPNQPTTPTAPANPPAPPPSPTPPACIGGRRPSQPPLPGQSHGSRHGTGRAARGGSGGSSGSKARRQQQAGRGGRAAGLGDRQPQHPPAPPMRAALHGSRRGGGGVCRQHHRDTTSTRAANSASQAK